MSGILARPQRPVLFRAAHLVGSREKLEEELDVKLFERNANEVSVTQLGEEIVRQAQSVLEQAANIRTLPSVARTRWPGRCDWG